MLFQSAEHALTQAESAERSQEGRTSIGYSKSGGQERALLTRFSSNPSVFHWEFGWKVPLRVRLRLRKPTLADGRVPRV